MRSPPIETNSLSPDLAARLAALRSPSSVPSTSSKPPPTQAPPVDLEARLRALEPPTEKEREKSVPIQTNDDEAVERFLKALETSSSSSSSPLQVPLTAKGREKEMLPTLTDSALDNLSGIEVEFMKPRPTASTSFGEGVSLSFELELEGEEGDLLQRIRDELNLESRESRRNEEKVEGWEERMNKLRQGGAGGRISSSSTISTQKPTGLGEAPGLGGLEKELLRRRKRRKEKRARKGGESESEESETETESETESEQSTDEEEDDSG
ncbi:uncharacterized protein JCM6883_001432 [Sporobolomyces salmoneus]|uniref:uncharacterized protein n=1 Tax=Sporobolomyces salmoneus TaxID=183962 RepID=UPI0031737976